MSWKRTAMVVLAAAVGASCTSAEGSSPTPAGPTPTAPTPAGSPPVADPAAYHPNIDPATFVAEVTNPYFPLVPGSTYVYEGVRDGALQRDTFVVTGETKEIM